MAYEVLQELPSDVAGAGQSQPEGSLVGAVGFCAAHRPTDLPRRIFYGQTFESRLFDLLEMPALRRARHYFATRYERSSRRIVLYGEITCAGCTTSRVRVSVR